MSKTDAAAQTATEQRPTTDTAIKGWVGIINGVGQLSEIAASRGIAEMTLGNRGDKDECRLVPVTVIADLTGKPRCIDAGGKFPALPVSTQAGIAALLAAHKPSARQISDDAYTEVLDAYTEALDGHRAAYAEAVDGFPITVANEALKLLLLREQARLLAEKEIDPPSTPCPPTPEAIREVCEIVWRHEEGNRS